MRSIHRLVAVLAGLLLAVGLVTAVSPAQAADKIEREITINGKEPKENKFLLKGKISPSTGKPVNAIIEVKHCKQDKDCGAKWHNYTKFKTNKKGRYSERVQGPKKGYKRVYYRVHTKGTDKYKAATSDELYIYRIF